MRSEVVQALARECGFELAGVARAEPLADDFARYRSWTDADMAGKIVSIALVRVLQAIPEGRER